MSDRPTKAELMEWCEKYENVADYRIRGIARDLLARLRADEANDRLHGIIGRLNRGAP